MGPADRGVALVFAVMTMLLLTAMGAALVLTTSAESMLSSGFRGSQQALYAADAASEWVLADLAAVVPDWPTLLTGSVRSPFVDGPAAGTRELPDGSVVNLSATMTRNPGWQPYAFGRLRDLLPPSDWPSPFYVVLLVAADPQGPDRLRIHTEAFGPRGAHKVLELNASRGPAGVKFEAWREVR